MRSELWWASEERIPEDLEAAVNALAESIDAEILAAFKARIGKEGGSKCE